MDQQFTHKTTSAQAGMLLCFQAGHSSAMCSSASDLTEILFHKRMQVIQIYACQKHIPVRFRGVILKLSGQNSRDETTRVPAEHEKG